MKDCMKGCVFFCVEGNERDSLLLVGFFCCCGKICVNFTVYKYINSDKFFITIYRFVCWCVCFSFACQCVGFADEMYINIYDFFLDFCFVS